MNKILLHSIGLAGFRAYLAPQIVELHSKNLAIFAPNGRGKSSLADAIEFYFSPATTLPRFGEKATGNQAGYTALAHNAAEKAGIKPSVTLNFRARGEAFGTARLADGKMPRTEAGDRVAAHHRVDAVVRGHALRGFVEDTSPDKRYTQVSDWLSLSSLTEAQKAIKALRDQVGTDIKDTANKASAERRISRLTGETVKTWDAAALDLWIRSTYLDKLGLGEAAFEFRPDASLVITLRALIREEEAKVGLTALKQRLAAIQNISALPDADTELLAGTLVAFENAIRAHITELLNELRSGTNDIYKAIQGDAAAPVRLELPKETDKLQNRLGILVDFAENRKGVAPSGYLSDSQLHSVALAFRLAAVRRFNPGMPLIVLDDISTSYDADYRRHLVTALKTWMGDCQLIVLTHDQRFFTYLREMLPPAEWGFKQITSLDSGYGPRLATHLVKDEEVEQAWAEGKSAANLIRQIEDEALLRWAQDFEVDIRIRKTNKPFDYGRAELAEAIARYFREVGLKPPRVEGVFNPFLDSLREGNVENFGSHFQDGPWGDGSHGDEKARWTEFKAFRSALRCPQCSGARFRRPYPQRYAVCAKPKCETQLRFT